MATRRKQLHAFIIRKHPAHLSQACLKAGTAFVNEDGSISILLDVLPIDGRVELRESPPGCLRAPKIALA